MPRYASIDIGSNSVRMEAAEVSAGQPSRILASERQVTRLGASVFRTGRISQEAMDLICGVLGGMAQQYKRLDVVAVRAVATAAVRDAGNQHDRPGEIGSLGNPRRAGADGNAALGHEILRQKIRRFTGHAVFVRPAIDSRELAAEIVGWRRRCRDPFERRRVPRVR